MVLFKNVSNLLLIEHTIRTDDTMDALKRDFLKVIIKVFYILELHIDFRTGM